LAKRKKTNNDLQNTSVPPVMLHLLQIMDEERMRFTFAIGSLPSKAKSSTILAPGILGCIKLF
jgi:hypothetical protein